MKPIHKLTIYKPLTDFITRLEVELDLDIHYQRRVIDLPESTYLLEGLIIDAVHDTLT